MVDGSKLVAQIVNVSLDESILAEDGKIDLGKFEPLVFDWMRKEYHLIGEKAGNAYRDGAEYRRELRGEEN